MKRVFIKVEGIVQGVGFRPFVYNLARSLNLNGWVNNNSEGVYIDIQGFEINIEHFINVLKNNAPPLAKIENIIITEKELGNYVRFEIKISEINYKKITLISPDIATCRQCTEDIMDSQNRRYKYAFTNCTNCGPRFSIIKSIPYDRDKTTMSKFKMCDKCNQEYMDAQDRRFHAQPNACEECGPHLWIEEFTGTKIDNKNVFEFFQQKIKAEKIFAIKGIGGFNLVCDGTNEKVVELLRIRKKRPHKPFAVMMKDIDTVRKYCEVNNEEISILTGIRKPIVILKQRMDYNLPKNITPFQNTLGVMLPYSPLHMLLFSEKVDVLIMTSANIHGLPLEYSNENAKENLKGLVDYFLLHNRDIYIPVDDSVTRVIKGEERIIRRARGYVPEPIKLSNVENILACGSNMKNTFCIAKENFLFLSQHNGDLENLETFEHYKNNIEHFKHIFSFVPQYLACDMHPEYASRQYANNINLPKVLVQHHHAHIVSCMVENNAEGRVIGIAFDGTGYGSDGNIWGGEFMICSKKEFKRVGHLGYIKMPGGEKAIKEPWRMGISYVLESLKREVKVAKINNCKLSNEIIEEHKSLFENLWGQKVLNILKILEANINCPKTSSIGRLFDAVSSIIGLRDIITYEGQASIELEALIQRECLEAYPYEISKIDFYVVEVAKMIKSILEDINAGISKEVISAKFHNTVVKFTVNMCNLIKKDFGIREAALSGGVFQNSYLLEKLIDELEKEGFVVYTHKNVPTNDGGVALGQIVIANEIIRNGNVK